jgi:hypothetical protein
MVNNIGKPTKNSCVNGVRNDDVLLANLRKKKAAWAAAKINNNVEIVVRTDFYSECFQNIE